jgi:DNA-binding beta-propeller fold protein YncE
MLRTKGFRFFVFLLALQFVLVPSAAAASVPRISATIGLGNRPDAAEVNPFTSRIYVVNSGSDTVSAITQ